MLQKRIVNEMRKNSEECKKFVVYIEIIEKRNIVKNMTKNKYVKKCEKQIVYGIKKILEICNRFDNSKNIKK